MPYLNMANTHPALLPNPGPLPTLRRLHGHLALRILVPLHVQYPLHLAARHLHGRLRKRPFRINPPGRSGTVHHRPAQRRLQRARLPRVDVHGKRRGDGRVFRNVEPMGRRTSFRAGREYFSAGRGDVHGYCGIDCVEDAVRCSPCPFHSGILYSQPV